MKSPRTGREADKMMAQFMEEYKAQFTEEELTEMREAMFRNRCSQFFEGIQVTKSSN